MKCSGPSPMVARWEVLTTPVRSRSSFSCRRATPRRNSTGRNGYSCAGIGGGGAVGRIAESVGVVLRRSSEPGECRAGGEPRQDVRVWRGAGPDRVLRCRGVPGVSHCSAAEVVLECGLVERASELTDAHLVSLPRDVVAIAVRVRGLRGSGVLRSGELPEDRHGVVRRCTGGVDVPPQVPRSASPSPSRTSEAKRRPMEDGIFHAR
jgi:hypothetical protein